jgi:hypothetical protein
MVFSERIFVCLVFSSCFTTGKEIDQNVMLTTHPANVGVTIL